MPHASTYAARRSLDKELRYLSNLSIDVIYPWVKSKSIPMGHLPTSKLLFECRMDKYEARRQNVIALIERHCDGRAATLADRIETSASYVSRMLYPEGKNGKKRIGEDVRDRIEDAFSLRRGSLDEAPGADIKATDGVSGQSAPALSLAGQKSLKTEELPVETTLERVDASEKEILELYRRANMKGKSMIKITAEKAPKSDV